LLSRLVFLRQIVGWAGEAKMLRWLRGWVLLLRARGFSPLPPAGRRQAREIISKKLSGKCGRQNASGRARDKATLQFFQTARLRGQISTVVLQRNAHQQWRLAQQTMFYGYLRVSIPKARMIAWRHCLFEASAYHAWVSAGRQLLLVLLI